MKTTILLTIEHSKPLPDITDVICSRVWPYGGGCITDMTAAIQEDTSPPVEVASLRELAATCYAGLGAECNLPEPWLDALNAAANGEPFSTDGLLPFEACASVGAEPSVEAAAAMGHICQLLAGLVDESEWPEVEAKIYTVCTALASPAPVARNQKYEITGALVDELTPPTPPAATGWPAGMLQDDDRKLSKALAKTPHARRIAEEQAEKIRDASIAKMDVSEAQE